MKKAIICFLFITFNFSLFAQNDQGNALTSIAMLNYIGTQTILIEQSKNNRLLLEEITNKLYNNSNPSIIDVNTQNYLNNLINSIDGLRLVTIQREKIQFIHDSQKAQAISQAMPNPLYLLALKDKKPLDIIMTAALMAVDSAVRYNTAQSKAESDLILANFDIETQELIPLSNLKRDYFNHMINITRIYRLDGSESLSQESIERFVNNILDTNKNRVCEWLEQNRALYSKYAPYWLTLADLYYDLGKYQQCLDSIQRYESVQVPIFRKDFDFARVLPKAIIAASNVYNDNANYISAAKRYLQMIKENSDERDWALKYFAAQVYISLAAVNDRQNNLQAAYDLLIENITFLLKNEQDRLQGIYAADITVPSNVVSEKRKQTEKLVNQLKEERKTELPPMHSALVLHFQLIAPLMDELRKSQTEIDRISGILGSTIVMPQLRNLFLKHPYDYDAKLFSLKRNITGPGAIANGAVSIFSGSINWDKINLEIPAIFLSADAIIDIGIISDKINVFPAVQYKIMSVDRKKSSLPSDYIVKMELFLPNTLIIERDIEYTLQIIIKTNDMNCAIIFSSPKGKTNFEFAKIE